VVYFSDRASIFLAPSTHTNNERSNTQRARSPRSFEGPRFLAEPRTFLAFLTGLWGMLTGLSLLFALANVFVDVIPVTEHFQPLYRLPPTVVTPLASVTALFVLLATYARRGALPRRAVVIVHGDLRRSPSQPDSPHSPLSRRHRVGRVAPVWRHRAHHDRGRQQARCRRPRLHLPVRRVLRASPARSYC
jgi:hypothetical protein